MSEKRGESEMHTFCPQNKPSETNFWQKGDANDLAAKESYRALLTISLLMPKSPTWSNFSRTVKHKAQLAFNSTSYSDDEEVRLICIIVIITVLIKP